MELVWPRFARLCEIRYFHSSVLFKLIGNFEIDGGHEAFGVDITCRSNTALVDVSLLVQERALRTEEVISQHKMSRLEKLLNLMQTVDSRVCQSSCATGW